MTPRELWETYTEGWRKFVHLYNYPGELVDEPIGYTFFVGLAYFFWLYLLYGILKAAVQAIFQKHTVLETRNTTYWNQTEEPVFRGAYYWRFRAERHCRRGLRKEIKILRELNPDLKGNEILNLWKHKGQSFRIMDDLAFDPDAVVLDLLNLRD